MNTHIFSKRILKSKFLFAFIIFFFIFFFYSYLSSRANAATYYVSPSGNNSNTGTSLADPWLTLEHAASTITGGDDVFVRAGTYNLAVTLDLSFKTGTALDMTTFQSYNNEAVVIDGNNLTLSDDQAIVTIGGSKYLRFEGFEVTDSRLVPQGRGISLYDVDSTDDFIYILNNTVHNIKMQAINIVGENIFVEGNEVYDACMVNANQAFGGVGGWPVAISTFYEWGTAELSSDLYIRNNHVHHNWGEGIAPLHAENVEISGNTVNDNYSVNIYLDNTRNVEVFNNYVYSADTTRDRTLPADWGGHAMGIGFATEVFNDVGGGTPTLFPTNNLLIYNNVLVNNSRGINYFNDPLNTQNYNTYGDIQIFNNVIYRDPAFAADAGYAISFYDVPASYTQPFGTNEITNNIIYSGGDSLELNLSMDSSDTSYWLFSNNDWVNGIPSVGTQTNSYSFDPLFTAPSVGGDINGFKLNSTSQAIDSGLDKSSFADYEGVARDANPNLGVFENTIAAVTPTPTLTPTTTPTVTISPSVTSTVAPTSTPTTLPSSTITVTPSTTIINTPTNIISVTDTVSPTVTNTDGTLAETGGSMTNNFLVGIFISAAVFALSLIRRRIISLRELKK